MPYILLACSFLTLSSFPPFSAGLLTTIIVGISLGQTAAGCAGTGISITFLGSMLFGRNVSGTRVIDAVTKKTVGTLNFVVSHCYCDDFSSLIPSRVLTDANGFSAAGLRGACRCLPCAILDRCGSHRHGKGLSFPPCHLPDSYFFSGASPRLNLKISSPSFLFSSSLLRERRKKLTSLSSAWTRH